MTNEPAPPSPYLFTAERRTPTSATGFRKQLAVIEVAAELLFPVHPHMLRHACGFAFANGRHDTRVIQEGLGHRDIQYTTRYTELTTHRFKDS
jgi:type 1 fimbriae regulatory protein FimB/type 1 fimbriae regulatory protein FimE